MEYDGWNINMGKWITSQSFKLAMINTMCLQCCMQPLNGWKQITFPMPLPEISWALKTKSCSDMAPRKNWIRQQDSCPKQPRKYLGRCGIEYVYHIHCHAPASGKIVQYSGVLKTTFRTVVLGHSNMETHLAKATWSVNIQQSVSQADCAQFLHSVERYKVSWCI